MENEKRTRAAGAGRPQDYRDRESHTITAPAAIWRYLEEIGEGNRSAGLRELAKMAGLNYWQQEA